MVRCKEGDGWCVIENLGAYVLYISPLILSSSFLEKSRRHFYDVELRFKQILKVLLFLREVFGESTKVYPKESKNGK